MDRVPPRGARDVGEHARGRGLPVGPGHARDAVRELGREGTDEVGIQGERDESGKRGRAAAGRTEAFSGEFAGCVGDERERVRHE